MPFNLSNFYKYLKTTFVSGTYNFETIDSTNSYLKNLTNLKTGELVIAETQTEGKGRRGNRWQDVPEQNLLFSISYIPRKPIENPGILPLVCSLSINRVCRNVLGHSTIKWPNDVKVANKKIAGILIESRTVLTMSSFIIGAGVNVNQAVFDDELKSIATSFYQQSGEYQEREKILALVINEIAADIKKIENDKWLDLLDEYKTYCETLNKKVSFEKNGKTVEGLAQSVNTDGSLSVIVDGQTVAFHGNEINYIKVIG